MKEQEEPHLMDLEDVTHDLEAMAIMVDGLSRLSLEGDHIKNFHKSLFMLGNLINEKADIIDKVFKHELSQSRAAKETAQKTD